MKRLISFFLILTLFFTSCSIKEVNEGKKDDINKEEVNNKVDIKKDLVKIVKNPNKEKDSDYVRVSFNPTEKANLKDLKEGEILQFDILNTLTWKEAMDSGFYIPEIENIKEGYIFTNWDFDIIYDSLVEDKTINGVFDREKMDVNLYFVKKESDYSYLIREVHEVDKELAKLRVSLEELIHSEIYTEGAIRPIDEKTKILEINIEDNKAIVDFSKDIMDLSLEKEVGRAKIEAIVNTLTEFDNVDIVEFLIEGSKEKGEEWLEYYGYSFGPLVRDLSNVYEPAIWFISPKEGELVEDKIHVKGSMMVFESLGGYILEDSNGNIIKEGKIMGENQEGFRSFFDFTISFDNVDTDKGILSIYGFSGKDNSKTDITSVSVRFK